jgi:hypothetical protein
MLRKLCILATKSIHGESSDYLYKPVYCIDPYKGVAICFCERKGLKLYLFDLNASKYRLIYQLMHTPELWCLLELPSAFLPLTTIHQSSLLVINCLLGIQEFVLS